MIRSDAVSEEDTMTEEPEPNTYIRDAAGKIAAQLGESYYWASDIDRELYRLYALLALVKGTATTLEDVHDAWSVWQVGINLGHQSIVPFGELTAEVQELDGRYAVAIWRVAVAGLRGGR